MLEKISGGSLLIGIAIGTGLTFIGGAAAQRGGAQPASAPAVPAVSGPIGRFQAVATHSNDQMTAYVIDTQTGQSVQLYGNGHVSPIADPWKSQP